MTDLQYLAIAANGSIALAVLGRGLYLWLTGGLDE
jgi:hypothetical protein